MTMIAADGDDADAEQDPEALRAQSFGDLASGDEDDRTVETSSSPLARQRRFCGDVVGWGRGVFVGGTTDEVEEDLGERASLEAEAAHRPRRRAASSAGCASSTIAPSPTSRLSRTAPLALLEHGEVAASS